MKITSHHSAQAWSASSSSSESSCTHISCSGKLPKRVALLVQLVEWRMTTSGISPRMGRWRIPRGLAPMAWLVSCLSSTRVAGRTGAHAPRPRAAPPKWEGRVIQQPGSYPPGLVLHDHRLCTLLLFECLRKSTATARTRRRQVPQRPGCCPALSLLCCLAVLASPA